MTGKGERRRDKGQAEPPGGQEQTHGVKFHFWRVMPQAQCVQEVGTSRTDRTWQTPCEDARWGERAPPTLTTRLAFPPPLRLGSLGNNKRQGTTSRSQIMKGEKKKEKL